MANKLTSALLSIVAASTLFAAAPGVSATTLSSPKLEVSALSLLAQGGVSYSTFSVRNNTASTIRVTIRYKDYYEGWTTKEWVLAPYEKAYLVDTANRYLYVSAVGEYNKSLSWSESEVNIGRRYTKFTYTLNY